MSMVNLLDTIFSQVEGVRFDIDLWNGQSLQYGSGRSKAFTLVFKDEWTAKRLLSQGALGFGESYMEGKLLVEGDLEAYLSLRHQFKKIKLSPRMMAAAYLSTRSVPKNTKEQISYHYDIGNDFFGLILDQKSMSYSCGLYDKGVESLAAAQQNKIKLVCDWLDLPAGANVLDLGCGWGGFAVYAAQKHNWKITACTLSKQQYKYCQKLVKANALHKKVSLKCQDMLKDLPAGEFDAIVMIESIEHVGKSNLEDFINKLYDKLRPGGVLYIQTTGKYKPKMPDKWTLKYVFPGGYLPSQQELVDAASGAGFELQKFIDDTPSYVLTLKEWIKNLESNRSKIEQMFDPKFYRLWELWMHGAKVAFEVNSMGLFRIKLRKPLRLGAEPANNKR